MARKTFIRFQLRKKFESISSNDFRDIAKSLKISFGVIFVSLREFGSKVSIPSIHLSNKKKPHSIIFTRSQVLVYTNFADGQTFEKVIFSYCSRIYVHVYTYLDYLSNFTSILTKVRIPYAKSEK